MKKKNNQSKDTYASWKELFRFYRKVKLPWGLLLVVFLLSFAVKETQAWIVPYTTKIQTGAIEQAGFLGGFVVMTLIYGITEAVQGSLNEMCGVVTTRNVRHTVWSKLIRLPMSVFTKEDPFLTEKKYCVIISLVKAMKERVTSAEYMREGCRGF